MPADSCADSDGALLIQCGPWTVQQSTERSAPCCRSPSNTGAALAVQHGSSSRRPTLEQLSPSFRFLPRHSGGSSSGPHRLAQRPRCGNGPDFKRACQACPGPPARHGQGAPSPWAGWQTAVTRHTGASRFKLSGLYWHECSLFPRFECFRAFGQCFAMPDKFRKLPEQFSVQRQPLLSHP